MRRKGNEFWLKLVRSNVKFIKERWNVSNQRSDREAPSLKHIGCWKFLSLTWTVEVEEYCIDGRVLGITLRDMRSKVNKSTCRNHVPLFCLRGVRLMFSTLVPHNSGWWRSVLRANSNGVVAQLQPPGWREGWRKPGPRDLIFHLALMLCTFTLSTSTIPSLFPQAKLSSLGRKESHEFSFRSHFVSSSQEVIFTSWKKSNSAKRDALLCLKARNEVFTL